MVDVVSYRFRQADEADGQVANHLGAGHLQNWAPSNTYGPFNLASDYHPYCEPDWGHESQVELEQCE